MAAERRPRSVYGVGTEPDANDSLANERTALAGLRTSLGLIVAGVGLAALAHLTETPGWFRLVALILCAMGGWLAVLSVRRWAQLERALRLSEPLPAPRALPPLALSLAAVAVALVIALVLSLLN